MESQDRPVTQCVTKAILDAALEAQWQRMDAVLTNFERRIIENHALVLRESETRILEAFSVYTQLNEKALEKRLNTLT